VSNPREPRWQGEGAMQARGAGIVGTMDQPSTPQDAPLLATLRTGQISLMRRCRLLIGSPPTTASAPPCLRGNLPRSRPRGLLTQLLSCGRSATRRRVRLEELTPCRALRVVVVQRGRSGPTPRESGGRRCSLPRCAVERLPVEQIQIRERGLKSTSASLRCAAALAAL